LPAKQASWAPNSKFPCFEVGSDGGAAWHSCMQTQEAKPT